MSSNSTNINKDGQAGPGNGSGGRRNRNRRGNKKKAPVVAQVDDQSHVAAGNDATNGPPVPEVASSTGGQQPQKPKQNKNTRKKRQGKPQPVKQSDEKDENPKVTEGAPASGKGSKGNNKRQGGRGNRHNVNANEKIVFPRYWNLNDCLTRYNAKDPDIIRGTLRVLSGKDAASFCTCDRGSQAKDVMIASPLERNRALDGDQVFVELLPPEDDEAEEAEATEGEDVEEAQADDTGEEKESSSVGDQVQESWWQDDETQVKLWDPVVPIQRIHGIPKPDPTGGNANLGQRCGRVVHVIPPASFGSEINPTQRTSAAFRRVVGTLRRMKNGTALLTSANKSLCQFRLTNQDAEKFKDSPPDAIFSAKYAYGSWQPDFKWPPCEDVVQFGLSCNVEDETTALLIDNQVDHGEFPSSVLEECQQVVASGEYVNGEESGWKPTAEMYSGRRDFRHRRIFTIDPTTAKDLDDALHIEELDNGQIELGVHIADVSHFVEPNSKIDLEAQRRCTTVYLVDRTVPMLPRPLCEIACSLNENVERLAFSCVWRMNRDGSIVKGHKVWYGRSVIKSCARLDYSTAQNIIDKTVAFGENEIDVDLWPVSRRPSGTHTIEQVAADVRLMHEVAMARRRLRFQNGAVALQAVKLTFQLDSDRETPLLCEPYAIRDSNRLVEEYMLLANYLVAQRLITHAGGKALLRNHEPPLFEGLEKVVEMARIAIGFQIDISSSEALQRSLNKLGRECKDEVVLKTVTEMLKLPMQAANYVAAGSMGNEAWAHFALNIPYYTHFTSPIRRYADVIVHRLLQATLDGQEAVDDFVLSEKDIGSISERCNEKKEGSRKAQERSDTVFLALYLRRNPMKSKLGVVVSIGQKTFTVFVPSLGISALVFLDEHKDWIKSQPMDENAVMGRRIKLERIAGHNGERWSELMIKSFTKIRIKCKCQEKPPIGVKLELEGPWTD
jgi:DIS3-like exonuclease 2